MVRTRRTSCYNATAERGARFEAVDSSCAYGMPLPDRQCATRRAVPDEGKPCVTQKSASRHSQIAPQGGDSPGGTRPVKHWD